MTNEKPKIGKKGALREVTKKLTELRKKPISKEVFEIVQENFDRNQKSKKIAKIDKEVDM